MSLPNKDELKKQQAAASGSASSAAAAATHKAEVDRLLSIAREAEVEVETNLKRAQALRQAILAKAFSSQ